MDLFVEKGRFQTCSLPWYFKLVHTDVDILCVCVCVCVYIYIYMNVIFKCFIYTF